MTDHPTISIDDEVLDTIEDHAFSRIDVEVGGFLIGRVDGDSVQIMESRPALAAESSQTRLTFTHEAWANVLEHIDASGNDLQIIGWYHTHPNFGCFLSDYDKFIQENFFSGPGQLALVIDPVRGETAFFRTNGDEVVTLREGSTRRDPVGEPGEDPIDVIERVQGDSEPGARRRFPLVVAGVLFVVLAGALGWFIGSVTGQDAARTEARAQIDQLRDEIASLEGGSETADAVEETPEVSDPETTLEPTPEPTPQTMGPQPGEAVPVLITHTLRSGETLWGLAARYLGSGQRYGEIVDVNPGIDPRRMRVGDSVLIPLTAELQAVEGTAT
jgi:proteasome lid subunit RPN8/RPN11